MYRPNFNDPRVRTRCLRALGFACGVMSETKPHPWSTRYIDKFFGSQRNDLSKWLRQTLLICVKENWNKDTGECKQYILNKEGVRFLREQLRIENNNNIQIYPIVVEVAGKDHKSELESGNFEYMDKSNRLWHPLQRYRRTYKQQILKDHGYQHQYDIQCAAPTLIHQYSQQLGMDLYLPALTQYIDNRTQVRQALAQRIELDTDAVKEIINALFAGARIARNPESDIYKILLGDLARIEFLKQDPYIIELRKDIKTCWDYIIPHLPRRRNNQTQRLLAVTSRQKWSVYFELERLVLNSVRDYLKLHSVRYFLEHDGWTSDREIDIRELNDYIWKSVGYDLRFEYCKINNNIQIYPIVVEV